MKRIATLFLVATLSGTGCLSWQTVETPPAPATAPVELPPPPPVMPGQVTESNAPQVLQSLSEELDRATTNEVPPAPQGPPVTPRQ